MNERKYKLIVSDVDRTLLKEDFLIPDYTIEMVKRAREQGVEFPVSLRALYKHLKNDGVIRIAGDSNSLAKAMRIDGSVKRVLVIPQREIDGPPPEVRQVGLSEVSADDIPEEWKS